MSKGSRRAPVRTTRFRLTLEPLEDRLLLAAASVGPLPAAASTPAQSAATPADSSADADSASYATTATGATATNPGYAYQQSTYTTPASTTYANNYYTPAPRATPASATAGGVAALVLGASAANATAQQAGVVRGTPQFVPFVLAVLPNPAREALGWVTTAAVQPANGEPVLREAVKENSRPAPQLAANEPSEEKLSPDVVALETQPLFPLMLPLPGLPLGLDLATWERGVRAFFSRLDALGDEQDDGNSWVRLAPWCALAGTMAAGLEFARRHLARRPPPGLVEGSGRGLAWRWRQRSEV